MAFVTIHLLHLMGTATVRNKTVTRYLTGLTQHLSVSVEYPEQSSGKVNS